MLRIRAEQKDIQFYREVDPELPQRVCVDEKRLHQVLVNLLGNAVKFTEEGRVTFRVERIKPAESELDTAKVRFTIEDTGIGIPPEQVNKIFQPFEQTGNAKQRAKGTGLGLAISRRIVQLMGSEIQVTSTLGEGSTFWFEVELAVSPEWVGDREVSLKAGMNAHVTKPIAPNELFKTLRRYLQAPREKRSESETPPLSYHAGEVH